MRYPVGLVLCVLALAVAGCGSSNSSPTTSAAAAGGITAASTTTTATTHLAKTKFVLHAGLAFGAFHRWIYKPAKAGELTHPLEHKLTTVKAALAAAFVYHELKLALADAQADPTLSKLVAPITDLQNKLHDLAGSVKSGGASAADVSGIDGTISQVKSQAAAAGQTITEQTPATPSG
ncbi:MAG: hypothetical protein JO325_03070 [Solirubrobacterales bacterium]|nr:hypothetical protein [Solirubrobacterales bacterium]